MEQLQEVLTLFCRRYGLKEPDDSAGCRAIQGAMRGEVSIASLRKVLTERYELYPHYETQVLALLDAIGENTAPVVPAESGNPVAAEEAVATGATDTPRKRSKAR